MKTRISFLLLLAATILLNTGCIVIHSESHRSTPSSSTPADQATASEIKAAGKLDFETARLNALTDIARRPALSPSAQAQLVEAAYSRLSMPDSKVSLLRAVIANPSFCDSTRQAIVDKLQQLPFDSNRQAVLSALNERAISPTAASEKT